MQIIRKLGAVVMIVLALALACLSTALPVNASTVQTKQVHAQAAEKKGEQCQIVLAKLRPGERVSHVVSSQCVQGSQTLAAPDSSTVLLMVWYKDTNYGGASTKIYGYDGNCDNSGYGISYVGDSWNDVISSFKVGQTLVENNCEYTRAYQNSNYGGTCWTYVGDSPWVGTMENDKFSSFLIAGAPHSC